MHDYTASQLHEGRMRDLTQKADAYRLATTARQGRTRRNPRALLPHFSFSLPRLSFDAWRLRRAARS